MNDLEKALKIRNAYNQWIDHRKAEAVWNEKVIQLQKEIDNATYSRNGYEHFKTTGSWANREEAENQLKWFKEKYQIVCNNVKRREKAISDLLHDEES